MWRTLLLVVVIVFALSFFGISIRAIMESPVGQDNLEFVWQLIKGAWDAAREWIHDFTTPIAFPW